MPSTLTVLNNLDSGAGSLRAEIAAAHSGDSIVFAPNLNTIHLVSGELVINKNLTIQGPGAGLLTISAFNPLSGGDSSRLFEVDGALTNVSLSGLTISNGNGVGPNTGEGGAILNFSTLSVSNCTLSNNSVGVQVGFGRGGAIYNAGTLTVSNCALSNNSAGSFNPFIQLSGIPGNGGAIYNIGTLTVTNSQFNGNTAYADSPISADGFGGAIYSGFNSTATITGCWMWNNTAEEGGGIWNDGAMTLSGSSLNGNLAYRHGGGIYNTHAGFLRIWSTTIFNNFPDNIYNNGGHVQFKN
jgi:hypothetical protein